MNGDGLTPQVENSNNNDMHRSSLRALCVIKKERVS